MNNYWGTNFVPWQGGDFEFRYVMTSSPQFDPQQLTRFGREQMTPLESSPIPGLIFQEHAPASAASFLTIDNPSLAAVTWKRAEDGDGTILRLQNISAQAGTTQIHSGILRLSAAWNCSLLEENKSSIEIKNGELELTFKPFEILTIRLHTEPAKQGGAAFSAAQ
jgi:alpha-mannosidase